MSSCIFPGRFQPFHTGQLMVVQGMAKSCTQPIIVICHGDSCDDDIFSIEEVREMISASLLNEHITDATIVDVSDCESDDEWVDKVLEVSGNPDSPKVWTGDLDMKVLFEKHNIEVQNISPVPGFNGTDIRKLIKIKDKEWRKKVPGGTMEVVDDKFKTQ